MFISESLLFKGLDEASEVEVSKVMLLESYESGAVIYTDRTRADNVFILSEGTVRLTFGSGGSVDFTLNRRGEVFGWSSMVNRDLYSVEAKCLTPAKVYKIPREKLDTLFEKNPKMGMRVYQNLAGAVVDRLIANYNAYLNQGTLSGVTSFGAGGMIADET